MVIEPNLKRMSTINEIGEMKAKQKPKARKLKRIIRKQTIGFIGRLRKRCNRIVQTLEKCMGY